MSAQSARSASALVFPRGLWLQAAGGFAAAGVIVGLSVSRQWASCTSAPACARLRTDIGLLPLQAKSAAAWVPTAAALGALAATLLALVWIWVVLRLAADRRLAIAGLIASAPLVVTAVAAWLGVADQQFWWDNLGLWTATGAVGELLALAWLVYVVMSERIPLARRSAQCLVVVVLAAPSFGPMHQAAEFLALGVLDSSGPVPRYLGAGIAVWLLLGAVALLVLAQLGTRDAARGRLDRLD